MNDQTSVSRRQFLQRASFATAALALGGCATPQPQPKLPTSMPLKKLNIAGVGVGGMGRSNLKRVAEGNNIVALCDVDSTLAAKTFK